MHFNEQIIHIRPHKLSKDLLRPCKKALIYQIACNPGSHLNLFPNVKH